MSHMDVTVLSLLAPLGLTRDELGAERRLIARAQADDRAAFRKIFDRYCDGVHAYLRDLLSSDSAADEGTQEVFIRAHKRLSTLRESDKLLPWLLGIARNVALEQHRVSRRDATPLTDSEELNVAAETTPESMLLDRENEERFVSALAQLSEPRRAALLLRIDHGLPYEVIAETLGWSLAKVKVELHRARLQLRNILTEGSEP